jgi:hypothetical protein
MKRIKIISIVALILSLISMAWGIGVSSYYIDDLRIRGISTALLVTSNLFVSNLVGLIFRELKKY